jgi:hypothetical protein
MAKGKKPIQIDKVELQDLINSLEKDKVFGNRSELWEAVEESEFAKKCQPRPLTSQVAMLLCKKFSIEPITPKGKRGRSVGEGMPIGIRGKRKSKKLSSEDLQNLLNSIPKNKQENYSGLLKKAGEGSMKSLVKLKCLDCSCWEKNEVKHCQVKTCALYPVRPYH